MQNKYTSLMTLVKPLLAIAVIIVAITDNIYIQGGNVRYQLRNCAKQ